MGCLQHQEAISAENKVFGYLAFGTSHLWTLALTLGFWLLAWVHWGGTPYIYIYIYMRVCVCVFIYIYIYIYALLVHVRLTCGCLCLKATKR